MSAPDTNIEKQTRRHRPALWGIGVAIVAVIVFVATAPLAPDDDATNTTPAAVANQ